MKRLGLVLSVGVVALLAAACGNGSSSAGASGGGSPAISIVSPSDGAKVTSPFSLKVSSSEALGPTDSGKDHWHLYIDGNQQDYKVITSTSTEVQGLAAGRHTIAASLQHADHSPVGPVDKITVTVAGSGSGGGGGNGGGGGGGY